MMITILPYLHYLRPSGEEYNEYLTNTYKAAESENFHGRGDSRV